MPDSLGLPFALALTLAFSAKESLFKALFPKVKIYMGFEWARVTELSEKQSRWRFRTLLETILKVNASPSSGSIMMGTCGRC